MAEIIKGKNYLLKISDSPPSSRTVEQGNTKKSEIVAYVDTLCNFIYKDLPDKVITLIHASFNYFYVPFSGITNDNKLTVPVVEMLIRDAENGASVEELLSHTVTPMGYYKNSYKVRKNPFYTTYDFLNITCKGWGNGNNNDTKMLRAIRTANDILCQYFYRELNSKSPIFEAIRYQLAATIFYEFHEYFKVIHEEYSKYGVTLVYESPWLNNFYTILEVPKYVREGIRLYCVPKELGYNVEFSTIYEKIVLIRDLDKFQEGGIFALALERFLEFIKCNMHYEGDISREHLLEYANTYIISNSEYTKRALKESKVPYVDLLVRNNHAYYMQSPEKLSNAVYPYHPFMFVRN